MSRRQALASLAAGLTCLVAAPFAWMALQPEPAGQSVTAVNAAAAAALVVPDDTVPSGVSGAPGPAQETAPDAVSVPESTSAPTAPPPAPQDVPAVAPVPGTPVRIQVPALGIDNPIVAVGVTESGELEIPADVDDIGWYRFGPTPGAAAGSTVLTGHVDDYRQGPGAFADLGSLQPGDSISVADDAGVTRAYTVLSREEWSKDETPLDRLFDRGGSPRLVLITCGGSFDSASKHYEDNIGITAVPVES